MLSEDQKRKLQGQFRFLDADGNGDLEAADFKRVATELARSQGLEPGTDAFSDLERRYTALWNALAWECDANRDGKVTLEEWITYHDKLMQSDLAKRVANPKYHSPFEANARFLFDLLDANRDGKVSRQEYCSFCAAHSIPAEKAEQAFARIAPGGELYREELVDMVLEFYFSDDLKTAGSWLFGPIAQAS